MDHAAHDPAPRPAGPALKRGPLNFWERIYVVEVARGVAITSAHFFRNMWYHTLHLFGLAKTKPAAATIQYPEEQRLLFPRLRTRHRIVRREDGSPRCVACMMCETVCPARCIYIVGEEDPDPNIEKRPKRFDIDLGMCIFCGFCVEACPEDAIRMDTQMLDLAAYSRQGLILTLDQLLAAEPGSIQPDKDAFGVLEGPAGREAGRG
ncbi:MAG: NADH-quinone oxidoreductase subunit I [Nitrospirae bacterium]|nr:MAG: NADH-quinone oxidoreductase subunit I [Nitrospirota bacterium]